MEVGHRCWGEAEAGWGWWVALSWMRKASVGCSTAVMVSFQVLRGLVLVGWVMVMVQGRGPMTTRVLVRA